MPESGSAPSNINININNHDLPNSQHPTQQNNPSKITITNPHQKPPCEEMKTGVANDDVDWLFRGKSKKIVKKLASSNEQKDAKPQGDSSGGKDVVLNGSNAERRNLQDDTSTQSKDGAAKTSPPPLPPSSSSREQQQQHQQQQTRRSIDQTSEAVPSDATATKSRVDTAPAKTSTSPATSTAAPATSAKPPSTPATSQPEKASKLDRLIGRSRSSSASSVQQTKTQPPPQPPASAIAIANNTRRSSSFNLVSPSLTSDLVYNDHDEALLSQKSAGSSPSTSTTSSPGVTRSNSGKKGLFSSLSSKFKSSASSSSQLQQQQQEQQYSASQSSATKSPAPVSPKLNPSLLGSGANPKRNEDLIAMTDKPPAGMGIPARRRSSSSSKSGSGSMFKDSYQDENPISSSPNEGRGFFRRKSSAASIARTNSTPTTTQRMVLNKNKNRKPIPLKDLKDVKLRRVSFAIDKLEYDPQQQIPSRRPRKGDVLIPQDLNAPPPRLCMGIASVEGSKDAQGQAPQYNERDVALAIEAQKRALADAEKHAYEAHLQAKRIAQEVANFKPSKQKSKDGDGVEAEYDEEEEKEIDAKVGQRKLAHDAQIDQPLHVHEQHFEDEPEHLEKGVTLETIYTRCCHLREILPIPATLKQLKNKQAPLEVLKMLNPKPTLIDVLSFSDFIAITPINAVIFDNVTMTTEMLKIILGCLSQNKVLEKLSLRNVGIDSHGWRLLCAFLAQNKTIKKLDISQQRIRSDASPDCIRGNLNWRLFIQSIVYRGGIEELVINGCKLSDDVFYELINKAVKIATRRLGVAAIEMNLAKAQIVANYISDPNANCVGVDIAFNDLSHGQLSPFIDIFNRGNDKLMFLSINSTHLKDVSETAEFLKSLINVKMLRFFDMSSVPNVFPEIIAYMAEYLPQYPNLRRLHLDLNELSAQAIGSIATFLHKVPNLVHLSLLGNRNLNHSAAATVYAAVKQSSTLFALDLDYDLVSDELSQRIAFYLMRNMDMSLNTQYPLTSLNKEEDLMYDGSLLMETAEKLLTQTDQSEQKQDCKIQQIVSNAMLDRTRAIRKDIHMAIDDLFAKRARGQLSFEGKENLVRFCLLDSSLEKILHTFEEHAQKVTPTGGDAVQQQPPRQEQSQPQQPSQQTPLQRAPTQQQQQPSQSQSQSQLETGSQHRPPKIRVHQEPDSLHQSSTELISAGPILSPRASNFQPISSYFSSNDVNLTPHQVVVESNDEGKDVIIDKMTGRPVLMRSVSQSSLHAKQQEIEEGEFHKLGIFMQSRENPTEVNGEGGIKKGIPLLNSLPSGSELRDAIIAAKGIENVDDLIDKINTNKVGLEILDKGRYEQQQQSQPQSQPQSQVRSQSSSSSSEAISAPVPPEVVREKNDSEQGKNEALHPVVDEVYDKLLNDAERVRSKQDSQS
ncbi:hypothetical protein KGF57_000326 [Candida theae]|uniref:Uncharacterized protein n=1 Tax=Candida theae TaxID=1198502 RepID=A0AAD5BJB1_9ASCO|nr:uncharacterized protein KGF57_000326 [Candida theae]KAI5967598.1 hypothetical protein KGF57_000326 [Candida theae]